MKNFKKVIGFLVFIFLVLTVIPSVSYAAEEQQYTENLIPVMTNNTTPSGVASASDEYYYGGTYGSAAAWKAMDDNDCRYQGSGNFHAWVTLNTSGWIAYEFSSPQIITKYVIYPIDYVACSPKYWTFEAWNGTEWVVLDARSNVTNWGYGSKKEFTFNNAIAFNKYRVNIKSNNNSKNTIQLGIGKLEMMASITQQVSAPTDLSATASDAKADLSWDAVDGATSYNIKRSVTSGGPYDMVSSVTGSAITFTDKGLTNGTTYYYVISAVNSDNESANSNEVFATPKAQVSSLKLVLEVKEVKQLSVTDDLSDNADLTWTSSDSLVATVDENGIVKALKPGDTIITCTSEDGSYTDKINVLVVDLDLQLAVDLYVGDTCRLTVDDLTDTANVTWTSYDPAIASVSSKGKVTAVSEGLTFITATDDQGIEIGKIYIRVRQ